MARTAVARTRLYKFCAANDLGAGGTPSPAFDYGITYAASHAASWTTAGVFTVVGGYRVKRSPIRRRPIGNLLALMRIKSRYHVSLAAPHDKTRALGTDRPCRPSRFKVAGTVSSNSSGTATAGCTSGRRRIKLASISMSLSTSAEPSKLRRHSTLAARTTSTATRPTMSSRMASVRATASGRSYAPSASARTSSCMEMQ